MRIVLLVLLLALVSPPGWGRTSSALFYEDAATAIDWLCRAFGFEVRIKVEGEGGRIEPATQDYGEEYWSDRSYQAQDPEGHLWWFMQRLRTGTD